MYYASAHGAYNIDFDIIQTDELASRPERYKLKIVIVDQCPPTVVSTAREFHNLHNYYRHVIYCKHVRICVSAQCYKYDIL